MRGEGKQEMEDKRWETRDGSQERRGSVWALGTHLINVAISRQMF